MEAKFLKRSTLITQDSSWNEAAPFHLVAAAENSRLLIEARVNLHEFSRRVWARLSEAFIFFFAVLAVNPPILVLAYDSETSSSDSSCASCGALGTPGDAGGAVAAQRYFPGAGSDESTPGQKECTAPNGPLDLADGYGAIAYQSELASYVSATFDHINYTNPPTVGSWYYDPPQLSYQSGSNNYGVRFSAIKYRQFNLSGSIWQGNNDNALSKIVRGPTGFPGKAVLYDRSGTRFVFTDPYPSLGPTYVEKVLEVGGSYYLYEYFNPGSKPGRIWYWNAESSLFVRLWNYQVWGDYNSHPTTVDEYVLKTNAVVTDPFFDPSQWVKRKTTTFIVYINQPGYLDASQSDLIALDVLTYLSNGTSTSLARTVFKYHTSSSSTGNIHQLRAIIHPDSYRDFIVTEPGVTSTTVLTSTLSQLRGEPGGFSKNYLDEEYDYNLSSSSQAPDRLQKRTVRNSAGTCSCAGSTAGIFTYNYVTNIGTPTLDQYKVQVRIDKGSPAIVYKYVEYNPYGKRLVEAMVDPGDGTGIRKQVRRWQYSTTSGLLTAKYFPSACSGYDSTNHTVTYNTSDGLVYWYSYSADNSYLTGISFSKGASGAQTLLRGYIYTLKADSGDSNRFRYFLTKETEYQPDPANPTGPSVGVDTTFDQLTFYEDPLALKKQKTTFPAILSASPDQNGSGASTVEWEYFDRLERRTWFKDAAGAVHAITYDPRRNAATQKVVDVSTSIMPPPDTDLTQSYARSTSWPDYGTPKHLVTTYDLDGVGRVKTQTEPNGRTEWYYYTQLSKGQDVRLVFPHLTATGAAIGALEIDVSYQVGPNRDLAIASLSSGVTSTNYTSAWNSSQATIVDALGANGSLLSRTTFVYQSGHLTKARRYIDALIDSPTGNTYETTYGYDDRGTRNRLQDPADGSQPGTITAHTFDFLSRLETTSIGTNDDSSNNMVEVKHRYYDGATGTQPGLGDGNLTQLVDKIDSNFAKDRVTNYEYDYAQEGRLVKLISPTSVTEKRTYALPGWLTDVEVYAGLDTPANLRVWTRNFFDKRGQLYESRRLALVPGSRPPSNTTDYAATRYWQSPRGEVVKEQQNGGGLRKYQYDGAGRLVRSTVSHDSTEAGYSAATDLALGGDTVVNQSETLYDRNGNPTIEKGLDRDPAYGGTGLLNHGNSSQARGNYVALYYDVEDREKARSDYGDNGNADLSSPPSLPGASDPNQLLTLRTYTADSRLATVTDPKGLVTSYTYDDLGRLLETHKNASGTDVSRNRTTQYTYTPLDQIRDISAYTAGPNPPNLPPTHNPADEQHTVYTYGVNPTQTPQTTISSNRLVYQIDYPQNDGNPEKDTFGYNRQGELTYKQDIAGNIHTYGYTKEAALSSDVASPIVTGFDTFIQSIWTTYDALGRLDTVTSHGGLVNTDDVNSPPRNGILFKYDKYSQTQNFYQEVHGRATTSSRQVSYIYNYPVSGASPGLRLSSSTYPNGLNITENYNTGTDSSLNRVTGRGPYGATALFSNTYLGSSRVTKRNHPGPQVDWQVTIDRFARPLNLYVIYLPYSYYHNSYQYGSNYNSHVIYRKELTTSGQSEEMLYNGLMMMNKHKRGVHATDGTIPNPTYYQDWTSQSPASLDHSGNWRQYIIYPDSSTPYTRSFNKSNEVTAITFPSQSQVTLNYDANGNTTLYGSITYTYDAWNRLVKLSSGATQLLAFVYNGLHQKIQKTQNADNGKLYYYGTDYQVLQEYDATTNSAKYSYVWGTQYVDELVARRTESYTPTWEYCMQDANFNVVTRINASGSIINRYTYTAYGVPTQLSGTWTTTSAITEDLYLYAGREYHQLSGIVDCRSRFYHPALGRFLHRDSIGPWGDRANFGNAYNYVSNDPVNLRDPTGNDTWVTCKPDQSGINACKAKLDCAKVADRVAKMGDKVARVASNVSSASPGSTRAARWNKISKFFNSGSYTRLDLILCLCQTYTQGRCKNCNNDNKGKKNERRREAKYMSTTTGSGGAPDSMEILICCSSLESAGEANLEKLERSIIHEIAHGVSPQVDDLSERGKKHASENVTSPDDAYSYEVDYKEDGHAKEADYHDYYGKRGIQSE